MEVAQTGTRHIQGHIDLSNANSISALQKQCQKHGIQMAFRTLTPASEDGGLHVRNNRKYCFKEDPNPFEVGVVPSQGRRSELQNAMATAAQPESTELSLMEAHPLVCAKFPRFIQHYRMLKFGKTLKALTHTDEETPNLWVWGRPGLGKSRPHQDGGAFVKPPNKWWTGYSNEDDVLVEDIDPTHAKYIAYPLKIWGDRYPFMACVHYGMVRIRPKRIVVTSNYSLEQIFYDPVIVLALRRRFRVVHLTPDEK